MEIINKLKNVLRKCNNEEIEIYDCRIVDHFSKVLSGNGFPVIKYGYFEIGLYLDCVADNPTISLEYDLNGDDNEFLLFNDPDMKYKNEPVLFSVDYKLTYELFDEDFWCLLYIIVYESINNHNDMQLYNPKVKISKNSE